MSALWHHWSFDPVILAVAVTIWAHEIGLARLRQHSRPERNVWRRQHAWFFYAGLALLLVTIVSPLDYWASSYLYVHMIDHVIAAFFVPILVVYGAPWIPLMFALPVKARRRVGKFIYLNSKTSGLRAVGRVVRSPLFAVISFNASMLFWHIPWAFELSEHNGFVHVWLMHGSFLVTGTLFWLQLMASHPMKPARGTGWKIGAILVTNALMTFLAMSMSFFTTTSWYSTYDHVPGVSLSPFAGQQIAAALLWVCGDFWALPALATIIRRHLERGAPNVAPVLDEWTGRVQMSVEEFRGAVNDASS
ncbi:MAG: cytochrome c oxidase assembly protein [Acidobacteriota bacterium]|nr:cytochrome c oxidase assembly protein [Acidobacteriota bacterium]MDE3043767.1 cytochrome c oxidase assembly protein [Acidobacteriota bacterium]MDE3107214.1 cytochrome c oxidase assembly protein [Acidobacteriota bacterium]MDE3221914.1 cytochrome c oxidase assembly protein [Acidobacteriota bacterium]